MVLIIALKDGNKVTVDFIEVERVRAGSDEFVLTRRGSGNVEVVARKSVVAWIVTTHITEEERQRIFNAAKEAAKSGDPKASSL